MYCKNCGKQIDDKAEICPECGVRAKNLDIITLLGQIGLPGFRSGNKLNMVIATLVYISIFLAIVSGLKNIDNTFSEENQNEITPQIKQTAAPTMTIAVKPKDAIQPQTTIQNEDKNKKLSELIINPMEVLRSDVEQLTTAISSNDFSLIESYGRTLKDDSEKYIEQAKQFSVTSDTEDIFNEYNSTLQYFYLSGKYAEQGGKNKDSNDINTSSEYIEKAGEHAIKMREIASMRN